MQIASDFEGGRIELRHGPTARDDQGVRAVDVVLAIPADRAAPAFRQWFAFDALGEAGVTQRFEIENAGDCTWADGFGGLYKVFASEDDEHWFRIETRYANRRLAFSHTPKTNRVRYAYYPPYASTRLARLLVAVRASGLALRGLATSKPLVQTARGGQLYQIDIGQFGAVDTPERKVKTAWIIAQQHPGEPMAGWFIEGLVERLLSDDPIATALVSRARICIVPRMNPDGCALGNHRTNEAGLDLNREWGNAETKSIEVKAVRDAMRATGAAIFVDVHGDERLPYVFAQPSDRYKDRAPAVLEREDQFDRAMAKQDASYQSTHRYPIVQREKPNLAIAATWSQVELGAVGMTLEMPFSDDKNAQRAEGWSTDRSKALGAALVGALQELV